MAKTIQGERWRWLEPVISKEMLLVDMAKVCPYSEISIGDRDNIYKNVV